MCVHTSVGIRHQLIIVRRHTFHFHPNNVESCEIVVLSLGSQHLVSMCGVQWFLGSFVDGVELDHDIWVSGVHSLELNAVGCFTCIEHQD